MDKENEIQKDSFPCSNSTVGCGMKTSIKPIWSLRNSQSPVQPPQLSSLEVTRNLGKLTLLACSTHAGL